MINGCVSSVHKKSNFTVIYTCAGASAVRLSTQVEDLLHFALIGSHHLLRRLSKSKSKLKSKSIELVQRKKIRFRLRADVK